MKKNKRKRNQNQYFIPILLVLVFVLFGIQIVLSSHNPQHQLLPTTPPTTGGAWHPASELVIEGSGTTGGIHSGNLVDGAVSTPKIQDNAVTNSKIADNAVKSSEIDLDTIKNIDVDKEEICTQADGCRPGKKSCRYIQGSWTFDNTHPPTVYRVIDIPEKCRTTMMFDLADPNLFGDPGSIGACTILVTVMGENTPTIVTDFFTVFYSQGRLDASNKKWIAVRDHLPGAANPSAPSSLRGTFQALTPGQPGTAILTPVTGINWYDSYGAIPANGNTQTIQNQWMLIDSSSTNSIAMFVC